MSITGRIGAGVAIAEAQEALLNDPVCQVDTQHLTELGARQVEEILRSIEHGLPV